MSNYKKKVLSSLVLLDWTFICFPVRAWPTSRMNRRGCPPSLEGHGASSHDETASYNNLSNGRRISEVGLQTIAPTCARARTKPEVSIAVVNRRCATTSLLFLLGTLHGSLSTPPTPALAYTPDSDQLRESLYLMSRVQEATVQQERFASRGKTQEELKKKMKLSLRLVDRSYRLLDQINYASQFVQPQDELITATMAGNEAVETLQSAIDFVNNDLKEGALTEEQRSFLMDAMKTTREELFVFLKYMPEDKLREARSRVEVENVDNREEFDGDKDAGVYNPVKLPWKTDG